MPSNYPDELDALDDAPPSLDSLPVHSSLHNKMRDSIAAIQATVGTRNGSRLIDRFATVAERDAAITAPVTGQQVWVASIGELRMWNGSEWVTTEPKWSSATTLTPISPWGGTLTAWTRGSLCFLRVRSTRPSNSLGPGHKFLDLPASLHPTLGFVPVSAATKQAGAISAETVLINTDGSVELADATTSITEVNFHAVYPIG